jgi:hypothetical protein
MLHHQLVTTMLRLHPPLTTKMACWILMFVPVLLYFKAAVMPYVISMFRFLSISLSARNLSVLVVRYNSAKRFPVHWCGNGNGQIVAIFQLPLMKIWQVHCYSEIGCWCASSGLSRMLSVLDHPKHVAPSDPYGFSSNLHKYYGFSSNLPRHLLGHLQLPGDAFRTPKLSAGIRLRRLVD